MKTIRTTVSISSEQLFQLQSLADKHDLSLAWLIRQAVSEFLGRVEGEGSFDPFKCDVSKEKE